MIPFRHKFVFRVSRILKKSPLGRSYISICQTAGLMEPEVTETIARFSFVCFAVELLNFEQAAQNSPKRHFTFFKKISGNEKCIKMLKL